MDIMLINTHLMPSFVSNLLLLLLARLDDDNDDDGDASIENTQQGQCANILQLYQWRQ